jgi:dihydrofolate synthase/folylpolyglutamate synthase
LGATFFETTTALAFLAFAEAGVDFVVAEVGLGGRLDATNVLLPDVAAITNIAWDHADYLGHSLAAIAGEKAGIAKPGVALVLGRLEPEPARIVRATAARVGAAVLQIGHDAAVRRIRIGRDGTDLEYVGAGSASALEIRSPLVGVHQAWNAGVAALALQSLPEPWRPQPQWIREGIAAVRWPGRLQIEEMADRTWVFDVAHNTVGVEALAQALAALDFARPMVLVVAIMGDKSWPEMLPPLLAVADEAVFTLAPSSPPERRWDPESAARSVPGYPVRVIEDFGEALAHAERAAATVVVTGSHHTVGDAMRQLGVPVNLLQPKAVG